MKIIKINKHQTKLWTKRFESIIKTMKIIQLRNCITPNELLSYNIGLKPTPEINHKMVVEIISTENPMSGMLVNHPLCVSCKIGKLTIQNIIKQYYFVALDIYSGNGGFNKNKKQTWVPTDICAVQYILDQMQITPTSYLCDAGGGDCRVGFVSSCKTDCVENNPNLIKVANKWKKQLKSQTTIIQDDLYKYNFSKYTHIFLSLQYHNSAKLSQKLANEVVKGTKIFSVLNPLSQKHFTIEKKFPFVQGDSQLLPITWGYIQTKK